MFEKSLYDLIRGIRNHKGNEKEYIQNCLKECRSEIRGSDMDLKATALLKLIYLEMVGHDMSWASFHVLEVMSSAKYHQKRVGYLGAVQSFRPDTEVLMLATNLLKKDLNSASTNVISLPIAALPHVINSSLALSVLSDMLPRLRHSSPAIRKKTIVTLYRLALVYPETLRAAWPKIKERLLDKEEDSSVTSAIVNVVCELGWRRPSDFLPLAPRLFELLVDGGNNWMAIKLIKLFATLTPLEPRLVRKLLPPLTELIRTTPAMSLLYECINGIIQGGILGSADDASGREEIATLCVNKLRSMIMIDGDPNLKYVALLAFNKIVVTHPFLVSRQEDVILGCIDSPDITIRIKALDLVQGMVNGDNLMFIVGQLMRQLRTAASSDERPAPSPILDAYGEAPKATARKDDGRPPLPQDYRVDVIGRILSMCSQGNYGNIVDFDWYIDVLVSLVHMAPAPQTRNDGITSIRGVARDVSARIGDELRNVAVKVKAMRGAAVRAAGIILERINSDTPSGHSIVPTALKSIVWMLGEYAAQIAHPPGTLASLLQAMPRISSPGILAGCLQAVPKVFAIAAQDGGRVWTSERKSLVSLLLARILHTIEPLTLSPDLEVQERAVEFHELLKLTSEAVSGQAVDTGEGFEDQVAPLLLTQAIPSLFAGWELNSVAQGAQYNVPQPHDLDLDQPIHSNLHKLLAQADLVPQEPNEPDEFDVYYSRKPPPASLSSGPALDRLPVYEEAVGSYQNQQAHEESYLDAEVVARRRQERIQRNRDDPFYIPPPDVQRTSTPIHNILQSTNGPDLDIDNIPIMRLDLDNLNAAPSQLLSPSRAAPKPRREVVIASDETLTGSGAATPLRNLESGNSSDSFAKGRARKPKQSLLQVDSSTIHSLSLEGDDSSGVAPMAGSYDYEQQQRDEAEMAQAMKDIERLRLELQRSKERVELPRGIDEAGVVVTKKKAKKLKEGSSSLKKTKKKKPKEPAEPAEEEIDSVAKATGITATTSTTATTATTADDDATVVPKKNKKKKKAAETQDLI